jgi:hypothetical protein
MMVCHEVDYEILGHDMQIVEVELDPGETVIAEAGFFPCNTQWEGNCPVTELAFFTYGRANT